MLQRACQQALLPVLKVGGGETSPTLSSARRACLQNTLFSYERTSNFVELRLNVLIFFWRFEAENVL